VSADPEPAAAPEASPPEPELAEADGTIASSSTTPAIAASHTSARAVPAQKRPTIPAPLTTCSCPPPMPSVLGIARTLNRSLAGGQAPTGSSGRAGRPPRSAIRRVQPGIVRAASESTIDAAAGSAAAQNAAATRNATR